MFPAKKISTSCLIFNLLAIPFAAATYKHSSTTESEHICTTATEIITSVFTETVTHTGTVTEWIEASSKGYHYYVRGDYYYNTTSTEPPSYPSSTPPPEISCPTITSTTSSTVTTTVVELITETQLITGPIKPPTPPAPETSESTFSTALPQPFESATTLDNTPISAPPAFETPSPPSTPEEQITATPSEYEPEVPVVTTEVPTFETSSYATPTESAPEQFTGGAEKIGAVPNGHIFAGLAGLALAWL